MKFDLKNLNYLIAAAEHGSFRRAATALKVQESAISRRIRSLEDEIGASLFIRRPDGVSLTLAGQRFLDRVRQALAHLNEGALEVAKFGRGEHGRVRIGLFSTLASGFLSELFLRFDEANSEVHVDFVEGEAGDHAKAVLDHELDMAFVVGNADWPGCEAAYLWSECIFAAIPSSDDLSAKQIVSWTDIANKMFIIRDTGPGRQIRSYIARKAHEVNGAARIEFQHVGRSNVLNLVALGRGLTLTSSSETFVKIPGVEYRQIAGETVPFSVIWSSRNDNPASRRLLSLAKGIAMSTKY